MNIIKNTIIGKRFGKLTVVEDLGFKPLNNLSIRLKHHFKCKCDCGNEFITIYGRLISGYDTSCGCSNNTRHVKMKIDPNDLVGQKIGKLKVVEYIGYYKKTKSNTQPNHWYKCKCDCGNEIIVERHHILIGHTKSCGCKSITHRHLKTYSISKKFYFSKFRSIFARCYKSTNMFYYRYGGRGIRVADEFKWIPNVKTQEDMDLLLNNYLNFEKYLDELLEKQGYTRDDIKKLKLSIDRIDNDKGYERGNMRWATMKEQNYNQEENYFKYEKKLVHRKIFSKFSNTKSSKILGNKNKLSSSKNLSVEEYFKYHNQSFKRKEFEDYIQNYKNNDPFSPDLVKKYRPNIILDAITILVGSIIKSKISNTKYYKPNKIIDYNIINNPEYIITSNDGTKYIKY